MSGEPAVARPVSRFASLARAAIILAAGLIVFWPVLRGGWMWDDPVDVTQNVLLRDTGGLWRIWFHPVGLFDYYPLKYTVQWVQWHLWGTDPLGYHATNIGLHLLSSLLVWRILRRLGVSQAWLGGLIFAVHPLVVESVAWISELKNTLSLPLFLLSFDRFISYDEGRKTRDYAMAVTLFLAAMLCKTSVVMMPLVLLVYDWWKRRRITPADLLATIPFFVVSLVLGLVTWRFQQQMAIGPVDPAFNPVGGPLARIACAGTSAAFYVFKAAIPIGLMPIYPQWPVDSAAPWLFIPWIAFAAIGVCGWWQREIWGRHVLFGFSWFLLFAAPVLGFMTISSQRFTWVMDHLAYVPLLGLIGLATAAIGTLVDRVGARFGSGVIGAALVVCAILAAASRAHAVLFRNEETLWRDNAERNPEAWMAFFNLGRIHHESGRTALALADYQTVLRLRPDFADAYYNLGNLLRDTDRLPEAIAAYDRALQLQPTLYLARGNRAVALARSGRVDEAIAECHRALELKSDYTSAHYNLGSLLVRTGRPKDALPELSAALRLDPEYPGAENNLGIALSDAGQPASAIPHFQRAIRQAPRSADVHNNLGNAFRQLGRNDEAIEQFREALKLQPGYVNATFNLGCTEAVMGKYVDAIASFSRVVQLKPDYVEAHVNLAAVLAASGRKAEASEEYERARKLRPSLPAVAF